MARQRPNPIPGELWLRGAMILLAVLLGLFYCAAYMPMNRAHRLVEHRFPPDLQNSQQTAKQAAERAAYEAEYPRS